MMPGSSRPNAGSFPANRSRGTHRRQESVAAPQTPIDQVADAFNRLNADADGLSEIISELSKVYKHMVTLMERVATNFPKLRLDEIRDKDLGRRVGDLRDKIHGLGRDLNALAISPDDIWLALMQLHQNIDEMLVQVGAGDDDQRTQDGNA